MKIYTQLKKIVLAGVSLLAVGNFTACNESEFLKEEALDFYSPSNSFVTYENFQASVNNLYSKVRDKFFHSDLPKNFPCIAWSMSEITLTHKDIGTQADYKSLLLPTNTSLVYNALWQPAYKIIYDVNVIVGRLDSDIAELTEEEKIQIKAEALFFRGYMYKMLANLYGGVPLILEETTTPKRDYVRASRQEVYEQAVSDLKFSFENLPDIKETEDAHISNLVAAHVLSEVYLSLEKWQEAITISSVVIDHPSIQLMTERFGTRKTEPGDVYWDLFRQGNQNRSKGNSESLWVLQYEYMTPGGKEGGSQKERVLVPRLWQAKIKNSNGKTTPIVPLPNTYYYGRGSGFIRPSHYFFEQVWTKNGYEQDMRNSEYNIVRDFVVNNPASEYNGKWVIKDNLPLSISSSADTTRNFYPVIAKASTPGKHPVELWAADQTIPGSLTSDAQRTFRDTYVFRLAETHLLRAEAHLGKGDKQAAATDINKLRSRAQAPLVKVADVNLDYILDERIRELYFEELRLLTLARLNKTINRTQQYNPWVGSTLAPHNNLWPIPYGEIEKNTEAELIQNPGY